MNQLFMLGAYVQTQPVRETRLVADLTMPQRAWAWYDVPTFERNPVYVDHARDRAKRRKPGKVCAFLRKQAS